MRLEPIFTDGMVLQRGKPICVFGTGEGSAEVRFLGSCAKCSSKGGRFVLTLPPAPAGGPYEMEITLSGEHRVIKDIMVGEVFIASGQSNMEMPLLRTLTGVQDAEDCRDDGIRFFTVPRRYSDGRVNTGSHFEMREETDDPWQICDTESAAHFSAIGFYFAKHMRKALGIPVGIISCNWGARRIETFIPFEEFDKNECLLPAVKRFRSVCEAYAPGEYEAKFEEYIEKNNEYCRKYRSGVYELVKTYGIYGAVPMAAQGAAPAIGYGKYSPDRPGGLFETMVSHILPYKTRGVLWYQGEANGDDRNYFDKYSVLLSSWRRAFEDEKLPFFAVSLAPYRRVGVCTKQDDNKGWQFLREQQQRAAHELPYSYLAETLDCGDEFDIHPLEKRTVSERLWKLAAVYALGIKGEVSPDAAEPVEYRAEPDGVLRVILRGTEKIFIRGRVREIFVSGSDGVFYPAKVKTEGNSLLLSSEKVPCPTAARYSFRNYTPYASLYGDNGLPVRPFRTDSFEGNAKTSEED